MGPGRATCPREIAPQFIIDGLVIVHFPRSNMLFRVQDRRRHRACRAHVVVKGIHAATSVAEMWNATLKDHDGARTSTMMRSTAARSCATVFEATLHVASGELHLQRWIEGRGGRGVVQLGDPRMGAVPRCREREQRRRQSSAH
eukprot:1152340-Heterocapsa_arctica.AAC.1